MISRPMPFRFPLIRLIGLFFCFYSLQLAAGHTLEQDDPVKVISSLSEDVVGLISEHRGSFEQDPEPFYRELEHLMEPVVAFSYIAKNVMGKEFYLAASEEQRNRFETRFQAGLIRTYARGFFSYTDEKISVYPYQPIEPGARKAYVVQEIANKDGTTMSINYTMGLNKDGQWKLLNMVVNGINVGATLNSQFQQAMNQTGSLDEVIDAWAAPTDSPADEVVEEKPEDESPEETAVTDTASLVTDAEQAH